MSDFVGNFIRRASSIFAKPEPPPKRIDHRNKGNKVAIVLVHGFTGDTRATWADFVDLLLAEAKIKDWDLFGLGYSSSLRIDVPNLWTANPNIGKLALGLQTTLSLPPFKNYKGIALAAHSMGGLVVQRAVLDDGNLRKQISHLFLFGTPSAGLEKARHFARLNSQIGDMAADSTFIATLRKDWNAGFPGEMPFFFRTVAGESDEFVPAPSSVDPFPKAFRASVPGNHLEIVKPTNDRHQSFALVLDALLGNPKPGGPDINGARLAVELREFQDAIATLMPHAGLLDDDALASLALALEGVGRGNDALSVLEKHFKGGGVISSTDAQGILAGRLKRRWLAERRKDDLIRARELYFDALKKSETAGDHSQAYYHAINVAFLDLLSSTPNSDPSPAVREMAARAQKHCSLASATHWRMATEAEALLMLGDLDGAETMYRRAKAMTVLQREIDSMYTQAIRVATRVFGRDGAIRIERLFGVDAAAPDTPAP